MADSQIDICQSQPFIYDALESSFENSGASEIIEEIQKSGINPFQ